MPPAKYIVGEIAGAGGMGMVHRAVVEGQSAPVAIKQLRSDLVPNREMIERFEREIRICQSLDHPNISRVIDEGVTPAGAPFFVMPWVPGEPLGQRLGGLGRPPLVEALAIAARLLDALAYAHDHGIVHGDVKSDNLLITGSGDQLQVTLIDWGLARRLSEPASRATDYVSGTPGYMAPEVLQGEPTTVASDLYGAGVVLYELLTGGSPFMLGSATQIAQNQLHGDIALPSTRASGSDLPAVLDLAVVRALAKDPAHRYASARDLAAAISNVNLDVTSHQPSLPRAPSSEFSTTALTRDWRPLPPAEARFAVGTSPSATVATTPSTATDCLARVSQLLTEHHLGDAACELDRAVSGTTDSRTLWPLLLSLAAVHEGLGHRTKAIQIAEAAREHSRRSATRVGERRASALLRRLGRS